MSAPPAIEPVSHGLTRGDRLLILAVSLAALLPGVFGVSLFDRDEGWYAQVGREMGRSGDWIVPTWLGKPWLAKPPLLYWCVASLFRMFGEHAAAARMVSVIATAASVQVLATIAARMFTRRAAIIAAISFITALLPAGLGKLVLTDPLLLLATLAAAERLICLVVHGATWLRAAGFWAAIGAAVLAKGPAVFLFIGALGGALLLMPGFRRSLFDRRLWLAAPLAVLVAAPWYVAVYQRSGAALAEQFLGYEIASRLVGAPHGHGGPPGYYVLVLLAGAFPWTVFVPGALVEAFAARKRDAAAAVALIWLAVPWLVLELIPSKLPHYVLPCFAPMALLLGRMWDIGVSLPMETRQRRLLMAAAVVGIVIGVAIAVGGFFVDSFAVRYAVVASGAALAAGFGFVLRAARERRLMLVWQTTVLTSLALIGALGIVLLPALEPYRLSRMVAERINELAGQGRRVAATETLEPTIYFYVAPSLQVIPRSELREAVVRDDRAAFVARERDWTAVEMPPVEGDPRWERIRGFNYVKGSRENVWIYEASDRK